MSIGVPQLWSHKAVKPNECLILPVKGNEKLPDEIVTAFKTSLVELFDSPESGWD